MKTYGDIRKLLRAVVAGEIPVDRVVTATEACERIGRRRQSLDSLIASGQVDGWRAGRLLLVDKTTLPEKTK